MKKKLIEVALPLPEINDASAYDKMPGIGPHPKGIHHWWARLPLPTARAVLFASVVDDPSASPDRFPTEAAQQAERARLFGIIRKMMQKKLHDQPEVYAEAQAEMLKHCDGKLPPVLDPFAGGGSIPLEAHRLGFESHAEDLNPVAVLLNKCNLEIAPRWVGQAPVNPQAQIEHTCGTVWRGTHGLAEDVRYYGRRIREQALEKIGHIYPKIKLPKELGGTDAKVIAWLWTRTVASPNPAAKGAHVPLISTYWLSTAKGKLAWLKPVVNKGAGTYSFEVMTGEPPDRAAVKAGTKLGRGAKFRCLLTGEPMSDDHIKTEALAGRLRYRLLAIVAEKKGGRVYLPANEQHENAARVGEPEDVPSEELADDPRNIWCRGYGLTRFNQLFTPRQQTALVTLTDLVKANHAQVVRDARAIGVSPDDASAYATAVTTFLALAVDRCADFNNSLCRWKPSGQQLMQLFGRQAIPMVWDFAEANFMGEIAICWLTAFEIEADAIETIIAEKAPIGNALQADAATDTKGKASLIVSTDPPYYDNISYAGLGDFFYVWLRRTVGHLYPELFSTVLVPKMPELTASPERFEGDKDKAKEHFESGFRRTFTSLRDRLDPRFPLTVYYAFKQEDSEEDANEDDRESGSRSVDLTTGWETLLEALISSGFQITGTWPVRASQAWRMRAMGANALASYIVLACRRSSQDAPPCSRRDFLAALKLELPDAVARLQQGNVVPVDLAQAAIGPGMAVFSRYSRVLEADGKSMSVRTALALINQTLDEALSEQEGEFDPDTRWAIAWFDQHGFSEGPYGLAETLSTAKNTSVKGLETAGILFSKAGKVRLFRPGELSSTWDPLRDKRLTIWEAAHHLVRLYHEEKAGDTATAELVKKLGPVAETARDLAYRLFSICERRKWPQDALGYNALVAGWSELSKIAQTRDGSTSEQRELAI